MSKSDARMMHIRGRVGQGNVWRRARVAEAPSPESECCLRMSTAVASDDVDFHLMVHRGHRRDPLLPGQGDHRPAGASICVGDRGPVQRGGAVAGADADPGDQGRSSHRRAVTGPPATRRSGMRPGRFDNGRSSNAMLPVFPSPSGHFGKAQSGTGFGKTAPSLTSSVPRCRQPPRPTFANGNSGSV